jgi:hypothetical protein
MTTEEITDQLERIACKQDFPAHSAELVDAWRSAGAGPEAVDPILRFMEGHPHVNFGSPGAVVHFIEGFSGKGYERELIESVRRRPTCCTAWMLNRIINDTKEPHLREFLIAKLEQAESHPLADDRTRELVSQFLVRLGKYGSAPM